MQKDYPHLEEFQNNLSNNLHELQQLHEWYCTTLDKVQFMISVDTAVYTMAFRNEVGRVSRLFLSYGSTKLMAAWLQDYYNRLCAEKLVLETHMEAINQSINN